MSWHGSARASACTRSILFRAIPATDVLPTWFISVSSIGTAGPGVHAAQFAPKTEYFSAFSEFRHIYRCTSTQWTKSHVAFGLTMTETGGDGGRHERGAPAARPV